MADRDSARRLLRGLPDVIGSTPSHMPKALSRLLAPVVPHSALVILASDVAGGRMHGTGDRRLVRGIRGIDLDAVRRDATRVESVRRTPLAVDGADHPTLQAISRNGALLVLADPAASASDRDVLDAWNIVSQHIQEHADEAAPDYLHHARFSSGSRLAVLTELADDYSATLESILSTLRTPRLTDAEARKEAIERASSGLMELRRATHHVRTLTQEPVTTAFGRLKKDLGPLVRHRDVVLQFVDPPLDGRALPDEVARGSRVIARRATLALLEDPAVHRLRVQWDCDGTNLLMSIRDDGAGASGGAEVVSHAIRQRLHALSGRWDVRATPGWGTEFTAVLPLDPPRTNGTPPAMTLLRPREAQVGEHLISGRSNRDIAAELAISENTVKFHVSQILRKLGARSRAEAIAVLLAEKGP